LLAQLGYLICHWGGLSSEYTIGTSGVYCSGYGRDADPAAFTRFENPGPSASFLRGEQRLR
jgi:hypothetical protein